MLLILNSVPYFIVECRIQAHTLYMLPTCNYMHACVYIYIYMSAYTYSICAVNPSKHEECAS